MVNGKGGTSRVGEGHKEDVLHLDLDTGERDILGSTSSVSDEPSTRRSNEGATELAIHSNGKAISLIGVSKVSYLSKNGAGVLGTTVVSIHTKSLANLVLVGTSQIDNDRGSTVTRLEWAPPILDVFLAVGVVLPPIVCPCRANHGTSTKERGSTISIIPVLETTRNSDSSAVRKLGRELPDITHILVSDARCNLHKLRDKLVRVSKRVEDSNVLACSSSVSLSTSIPIYAMLTLV